MPRRSRYRELSGLGFEHRDPGLLLVAKAIEPGDFGSGDSSSSAFKTKKSGWVKIYIIAITVIGVVAVAALVLILLQG